MGSATNAQVVVVVVVVVVAADLQSPETTIVKHARGMEREKVKRRLERGDRQADRADRHPESLYVSAML